MPSDERPYELNYDPHSGILRLRLTGFWTEDTMRNFLGVFMPMISRLSLSHPDFMVLSDCRDYPVQSPAIGIAWARVLGADPAVTVPYAVVVGSILNKLQAERALVAPNVRIFTGMDDATAWLEAKRRDQAFE